MKKLFTILAGLLITVSVYSQKTVGTPISGTPIGLEHDPEGISVFSGKTDAKGQVSTKVEKGKYKLILGTIKAEQIVVTITLMPEKGEQITLPFELNKEGIQKGISFSMPSNGTVTILVRNPEPFNDPKYPSGNNTAGPQKQSISTTRSNIKH